MQYSPLPFGKLRAPPASPKCDDRTVEFRGGAQSLPPNSMLLAFGGMPEWAGGRLFG